MYEIIKNVILASRFELNDILKKIDTLWVQSDLSDEQKNELIELARTKANPELSYAPLQKQIDELFTTVNGINALLDDIVNRVTKLEGQEPEPQPEPEEYPEYKQPTGAHDAYHKDDKVTFNGERYICIAPEGVAVVWDPVTYPAYWKKV